MDLWTTAIFLFQTQNYKTNKFITLLGLEMAFNLLPRLATGTLL